MLLLRTWLELEIRQKVMMSLRWSEVSVACCSSDSQGNPMTTATTSNTMQYIIDSRMQGSPGLGAPTYGQLQEPHL
jgi:hypothetical protein